MIATSGVSCQMFAVAKIAEMPTSDEAYGFSFIFCQQAMEISTRIHIFSLRHGVAPLVARKSRKP